MDYETLLENAYEKVTPTEVCERFEIIHVCGYHEGTRTIITNFGQIASCIRRPVTHIVKFLSKELASQSEICGERLILSRKLSSQVINEKIEKYVRQYVLCRNCKKPDTELNKEKGNLILSCLACGTKYPVHNL